MIYHVLSRRIFFAVSIVSITYLDATSQQYKKLRFGIGIGKTESSAISVLFLEPSFRVNDQWSLGCRIEALGEKRIRECYSASFNFQHYVKNKSYLLKDFRLFFGLGFGIFACSHDNPLTPTLLPNGQQAISRVVDEASKSLAGIYPRIGLDYRKFSLVVDYNFIYRKYLRVDYFDSNFGSVIYSTFFYRSDNYIDFKIGYQIGGGTRKK